MNTSHYVIIPLPLHHIFFMHVNVKSSKDSKMNQNFNAYWYHIISGPQCSFLNEIRLKVHKTILQVWLKSLAYTVVGTATKSSSPKLHLCNLESKFSATTTAKNFCNCNPLSKFYMPNAKTWESMENMLETVNCNHWEIKHS